MKTKQTLRKLAEPFVYILLVAAFGFITTVVNQAERDERSGDPDFVTHNLKDGNETLRLMEAFTSIETLMEIEASSRFESDFIKEQTGIDL